MTTHPDLFAALAAPFGPSEVKARTQGGRQLHYVTARTVMNRLDDVLGPENWHDEYHPGGESSILCKLTLRLPDGQVVTKCDAGGFAGMADEGDDDKSGYSDAFKRAAVKFGVGRYLYRDGVPDFVRAAVGPGRKESTPAKSSPGEGPAPADLGWVHNAPEAPAPTPEPAPGPAAAAAAPKTGKALFRWLKDREEEFDVALIRYLGQWARLQDFPARVLDWSPDQVARGHAEALRKLDQAAGVGPGPVPAGAN